MSRRTSRLQRSPNTSMAALIGHPDRGTYASPILLAIYHRQALPSRQAVANHKRKEPPVLRQVAEGVLIHESEFMQSNAVVVHGRAGVLLIDPGVHGDEIACLANDLREMGTPGSARRPVTARPAARPLSEIGCRTRVGRPASPR